jgi:23S rRNA (adenine2503-C2)-methyltransferase
LLALKSMTYDELHARLQQIGLDSYRTSQIVDWVYRKRVEGWQQMTNLPEAMRDLLAQELHLTPVREVAHQVSPGDGTHKFLLGFADQHTSETVLMPMQGHDTVCVSSQVGCRFACHFCVTARRGLQRQLSADEIVQQVLHARRYAAAPGLNIVYMGMGEPLDNYDAVVQSIRVLTTPDLGMIGARRITVSTTGVVDRIRHLADLQLRIRLALSLNASNDEDRKRIMPVSARYSIEETLAAAEYFAQRTRHHVTLEYVLLRDTNDRDEDIARLRALGDPARPFKLNIIPFNPDARLRFQRPTKARVRAFEEGLQGRFRSVTVRWSMGLDIDAACGQLFGKHNESVA